MCEGNTACFFGHRKINVTEELKRELYTVVESLVLNKGITIFLFGSRSQFDALCLEVVTDLKKKYTYIQRIYVRAEFPYINDAYRKSLLNLYDETYFPEQITGAGKAVYIERNYEMIDRSSVCIAYYDGDYAPPRRKTSKSALSDYQPSSGTALAFKYAQKKNKSIINLIR